MAKAVAMTVCIFFGILGNRTEISNGRRSISVAGAVHSASKGDRSPAPAGLRAPIPVRSQHWRDRLPWRWSMGVDSDIAVRSPLMRPGRDLWRA